MHVLVVYCHPVETSFASALHQEVPKNLRAAGQTWCFGLPAMLKGFFDRLFMPGVAFDISDPANVKPMLTNIRRISAVVTYGRPRWMAWYMGDPPRRIVTRYLKRLTGNRARADFYACYHMNVATEPRLAAFKRRVGEAMASFA